MLTADLGRAKLQAATQDWRAFLDAYALPSSAPAALRNLDGVLAVAAQMALAVARLAELNIVHHDIKPANTIVGRGGVRVFDWGIACLSAADDVVNAAAAPAAPFRSTAEHACSSLRCHDGMSRGGTPGFMSPAKLRFFDPCTQGACTADELVSVDLFAVGASLLQLLSAHVGIVKGRGLLGDEEACPRSEVPQEEKKQKLSIFFGGLLASYFSLSLASTGRQKPQRPRRAGVSTRSWPLHPKRQRRTRCWARSHPCLTSDVATP